MKAQESKKRLDVCKISFTAQGTAAAGKKRGPAMVVYNHPDYLYAIQTGNNGTKTSWLAWYKEERLLKIEGKTGLPLNYQRQLKTNVYLPGETIDSIQNAAGIVNKGGDWDNENEYNGPGYGMLTFAGDTARIKGYLCRKAVVQYHFDAQCVAGLIRRVEIWYTADLPVFFLPPFSYLQKIPGAALAISMEDFDHKKATLRASSVSWQQKDLSFFTPSKDIGILYPPKASQDLD